MSKSLQKYLKKIGLKGAIDYAQKVGTHYSYLYQLASSNNKKTPLPKLAIAMHLQSGGEVPYEEWYSKKQLNEIWPNNMFFYHEGWKNNND